MCIDAKLVSNLHSHSMIQSLESPLKCDSWLTHKMKTDGLIQNITRLAFC